MRVPSAALCLIFVAGCAMTAAERTQPQLGFPDAPPTAPPLKAAQLPAAYSTRLDNGMEVVVVQNDEIPWVSVGWYLLTGSKADPPTKGGIAATTAQLLRQGTAKHSADELAALLDRHAISLSGGAGHETSVITAGTLSQYLDLTVETLAEVTRTPTFEPPEFRRHIQQALAGLSVSERDGAYLADRALRRRLYGDHYLGRLSGGESSSIRTLEREDLITFHETHYAPNHSMLIFSGAVSSRQATDLARKHFGDWPRKTVPTVATETIPEPGPTTIYLVDRPDATQTQVRIGQLGFPRQDSAYVPAQVFNQVFGGGFSSRLMRRVRIIEGLTYGARGGFSSTKVAGHLSIRTFTRNEETAKTVRVLLDETRKMRSDPPTDEEMNDARSYIIGRFGLSLETPQDVASKIFELRFFGLGENYYDTFLEQIDRVTPDDVTALAERRLDPDRLTIILVGKAADFEHDLDGIAPIVREAGP